MSGWSNHKGKAAFLMLNNIDTDQLIPARFMSQPRNDGYGDFLLHDMRRDANGTLQPDFVLNRFNDVSVLVSGENFGTGSSREAAAYALHDAGIRVILAPGFGDIFTANAINNGLLPACIDSTKLNQLFDSSNGDSIDCEVNLEECSVVIADQKLSFELDETWRIKLINGWDDIDLTLQHAEAVSRYRQQRVTDIDWVMPNEKGDRNGLSK